MKKSNIVLTVMGATIPETVSAIFIYGGSELKGLYPSVCMYTAKEKADKHFTGSYGCHLINPGSAFRIDFENKTAGFIKKSEVPNRDRAKEALKVNFNDVPSRSFIDPDSKIMYIRVVRRCQITVVEGAAEEVDEPDEVEA